MASETESRPARRGGRRFKVLLGVVVFAMVAWTAAWFAVASWFEHQVDVALASASAGDRVVACDDRTITGFPFRIELRCRGGVRLVGPDASGSLAGLTVVALVYDPTEAIAEIASPARLDRPVEIEAEWELAHASARLDLDARALGETRAEIEEIALAGPGLPAPVTADLVGLYVRPAPDGAADVDVAARLSGLVPFPGAPSADVFARLTVEDAAGLLSGDPAALATRLAREGVVVAVEEVRATSGETVLSLGGTVTLRPDGLLDGDLRLAIAAPGGEVPYLSRLSPQIASAAKGILGNVLPFAPRTRIGDTPARQLPITIRSGRVTAGVVPLGRIPPVVIARLPD